MSKPKVYVTRRIPEAALQILRPVCEIRQWDNDDPVPRSILREEVSRVDGLYCLLTERIDAELLDGAPQLKIVANMAVGYDNVDLAAATARGVMVTNTPGVLTETTADLAFALILAASRRLGEANRFLLDGQWSSWGPMVLTGQDVYGSTLGLIGLGRIGQAVARRARGFDMRLLYYDVVRNEQAEQALGIQWLPLDDLLRQADIVSIHAPLTAETHHLIGEKQLRLMKRTAVLVNTARGPLVDEKALEQALREGWIFAAGLDVFEREPVSPDHPLVGLPNVVALPHIGSASVATRTRMATLAAENLVAGLEGRTPPSLLNPEAVTIRTARQG
ncbi:MAG TPA: D-glycerate dehydrogenase [Firmicutes bacterium]|nr:D-glycerate dehydrogenase [Bacillota bacterium]